MGISARELRIGNFVMFKHTPIGSGIYPVMAIKDDLIVGSNGGAAYLNEIEPIPLTEEWLVRFGFESSKDDVYDYPTWCLYENVFVQKIDDAFWYGKDWEDFNIDIHSVHDFQNLYFALRREELSIKETVES